MTENVKVNIDVTTGNVGIDCPEAAFEGILNRVVEALPKLAALRPTQKANAVAQAQTLQPTQAHPVDTGEAASAGKRSLKRTPAPVYKMTDLGVDDDIKRTFKKFFEVKKPKNQNDQVLLCAFWLNKTLGRDTFTDDDVFTALRTAGAPKIPGRIESVISNLKLENKLGSEGGKYKITHIGEDFVNNDLPPKGAKA